MTMPDERTRSLVQTREFLQELVDSERTPGVPEAVRRQAHRLLRHYPLDMHVDLLSAALPNWFAPTAPRAHGTGNIVDMLATKDAGDIPFDPDRR